MKVAWKDTTLRKPGDHGEPTITVATLGKVYVSVHRTPRRPDVWHLTCGALQIHDHILREPYLANAQHEAIRIMQSELNVALATSVLFLARDVKTVRA